MNVELLKRIATKLRRMRHKKHFNMDVIARPTRCGTAACIAGHVLIDAGYKIDPDPDSCTAFLPMNGRYVGIGVAGKILGLNIGQRRRLFYGFNWPEQFGGSKLDTFYGDPRIYNDPKVAAKRIEHFIATKGKE